MTTIEVIGPDLPFAHHKNEAERQVVVLFVRALLAAGHALGVNDGEETVLASSRDEKEVFAKMSTTDVDYLTIGDEGDDGWVKLIYGNDGYVISDYTTNLEEIVSPISEFGVRFG